MVSRSWGTILLAIAAICGNTSRISRTAAIVRRSSTELSTSAASLASVMSAGLRGSDERVLTFVTNDAVANRHRTHHFCLGLTRKQAGGCHTFASNRCATRTMAFVTNPICDFRTMRSDASCPVMGRRNETPTRASSVELDHGFTISQRSAMSRRIAHATLLLSPSERAALQLLADSRPSHEIADRLALARRPALLACCLQK